MKLYNSLDHMVSVATADGITHHLPPRKISDVDGDSVGTLPKGVSELKPQASPAPQVSKSPVAKPAATVGSTIKPKE